MGSSPIYIREINGCKQRILMNSKVTVAMFRNSTGYLVISKRGIRHGRHDSFTAEDPAEGVPLLHQDDTDKQKLAAFAALAYNRFRRRVSFPSETLLHQRKGFRLLSHRKSPLSYRYL